MRPVRRQRLAAVALAALVAAAVAPATCVAQGDEASEIYTLGEGDQRLFLVKHGSLWSVHAENLATNSLFSLWHEAGGPDVESKTPVDRIFTLSVHSLPIERILERILDGYGYTLHYDATGRLERVRVYSPEQTNTFRTPRLVETLGQWRDREAPKPVAAAAPAAQQGAGAAPAPDANGAAPAGGEAPMTE